MAIRARSILKGWFERGDYPDQNQFSDLIDSLFHRTEDEIAISQVTGLQAALDSKLPITGNNNPNVDQEITAYPDAAVIILREPATFSIAIIWVAFIAGTDMPVHEIHVTSAGKVLKDSPSYNVEALEDYNELTTGLVAGVLNLNINFNSGPALLTVKKPIINYI